MKVTGMKEVVVKVMREGMVQGMVMVDRATRQRYTGESCGRLRLLILNWWDNRPLDKCPATSELVPHDIYCYHGICVPAGLLGS